MHVMYFHQHFSTPHGAAGTRSYEMARRLLHHGHEVTMVCGSYEVGKTGLQQHFRYGRRSGLVDGIRVIEFDLSYSNADGVIKRSWAFARFALASIGLALTGRYDLAFATTTPLTAGIPGILARWLRRKRFVFEVRDLWPELPREMGVITNPMLLALLSALEWAAYRSAHCCIALSPGIVDGIARRGVHRDRIALVPNGCDFGIFQASGIIPRRPAGIRDSELMALYAGTHGIANGLQAILDVAQELKARGRNDIRLVLVGEGKLKAKLEDRAKRERLDSVVFLPPVDKIRLAELMKAADLGLQCLANVPAFYYGTSPNKFFDYIAAGLPVLNNYPGWLAELIKARHCGFAVGPEDPAAFADALERAADNRSELKRMGENAMRLARDQFDRDLLADKWMLTVMNGAAA